MKAGDTRRAGWRRLGRPRYAGALTPRQQDVFELLVTGLTNEEIAQHLGITPYGVKYHVAAILQRLGVENRHDAVALHRRTERNGRLAAWAPAVFLRKLPFAWLPKAAAGASLSGAAAGIAVFAWSVRPISTVATTPNGCEIEQTLGSAPACAAAAPQEAPPGPSSGTRLAGGLLSPGGMKMGPDGMLYVAEAGTGGTTSVTTDGAVVGTTGVTGRISKIDPASGARTTVIDNLPNFSRMGWDASGPADVAFLGTQLYYLHTFGGAEFGLPDTPTGIYKVTNGTATLMADIDAFNTANPSATVELGGSGNSMTVQDGAFFVVDSLEHTALKITAAGVISRLGGAANVEPTRVTLSGRGPFYVNSIAPFPHAPEVAGVYTFPDPTGNLVVAAHDLDLTDVEIGPGGRYVHAVSVGGKVLRAGATGMMSVVVDGFPDAAGLIFDGGTAYFLNGTVDATGSVNGSDAQVWKITGFSSVTPAALPNAGTGPAGGGSDGLTLSTAVGRREYAAPAESDPIATVDALFAALNSGDAATAAAFFADTAVSGDAVGRAAIRARVELGIAAGFKHTRISGKVFDDGHVDVVDEVRGPFHALVARTYEFDGMGKIVLSKEQRSVVLSDDSAAPSQQQAITVANTGTGPDRDDRDVRLLLLALFALGVCFAAGGAVARRSARRALHDGLSVD